jgi:hypothetical protein
MKYMHVPGVPSIRMASLGIAMEETRQSMSDASVSLHTPLKMGDM